MRNRHRYQIREIDTGKLLRFLWNGKYWIATAALVTAVAAILFSTYFIRPLYRADFTVFINNRSTDVETQLVSNADTIAAQSLTHTYSALIQNRSVLEPAAKKAGLEYPYEKIKKMVSADIEDNTQLINIHVTAETPDECLLLADRIAETAPGYVEDIIEGTSMKIVSSPVAVNAPVYPNIKRNALAGALAGFAAAALILFLRFITDTKMHDIAELEEEYGIPVVGSIPCIRQEGER